jgi:hypothetical protein
LLQLNLLSNQGPELSRKSLSLGRNQVSPRSRENSIDESIEFLSFTDDNIAYDLKDFSGIKGSRGNGHYISEDRSGELNTSWSGKQLGLSSSWRT